MKRLGVLFLLLALAFPVQAAVKVATFGNQNSSGNYRIEGDSDGTITFQSDTSIKLPYEAKTTSDTLTVTDCGKTFSYAGTVNSTFTLPDAILGCSYRFVSNTSSSLFYITPNSGDTIKFAVSSIPLDASDKLTSGGTTQDSIELFSTAADTWSILNVNGTWADGGQ